jgi:hypothetical protein
MLKWILMDVSLLFTSSLIMGIGDLHLKTRDFFIETNKSKTAGKQHRSS